MPSSTDYMSASDLLASETLSGDGQFATVNFGDLSKYRELQILSRLVSLRAATSADDIAFRLNGDSGATSYQYAVITNQGTDRSQSNRGVNNAGYLGTCATDAGGFITFGYLTSTIPLPSEAIRHPVFTSGVKLNSSSSYYQSFYSGVVSFHMTQAAITSFQVFSFNVDSDGNRVDFLSGSSLRIYGVR